MPSPSRHVTAALLLVLTLLLAACGGADGTAATDATETATDGAAEPTPTADDVAGSEDPADPEPTDAEVAVADPAVCDTGLAVLQLIGDASNPDNDADQVRDAVELMGQAVGELEAAGADPLIVEAADAIHTQFAAIVGDPDAIPDLAVVEAAGAELRGLVEACGISQDDIAEGGTPGEVDGPFCAAVADFVDAGEAFAAAEVGSAEEQDAVAAMEQAAFAFSDAYGETDQPAAQAMFDLLESAQQFLESGETGDVTEAGELVDALSAICAEAGL